MYSIQNLFKIIHDLSFISTFHDSLKYQTSVANFLGFQQLYSEAYIKVDRGIKRDNILPLTSQSQLGRRLVLMSYLPSFSGRPWRDPHHMDLTTEENQCRGEVFLSVSNKAMAKQGP